MNKFTVLIFVCLSAVVLAQKFPTASRNSLNHVAVHLQPARAVYAPAYGQPRHHDHEEPHHYPKYRYEYEVNDPLTGDHKNMWEERDGDAVHGAYSLAEADGTTRVVEYTADDANGFNAIVKNIGPAGHDHRHL